MTAATSSPVTRITARIEQFILRAFAIPVDRPATNIVIEFVRIGFGLLMLHRALVITPYSVAAGVPGGYEAATLAIALCGVCLIVGFLTPVAVFVLFLIAISGATTFYLGVQVSVIVCWGLLLLGAGRTFSIDRLIGGRNPRYHRTLYILSPYLTVRRLALIRFVLIVMYSGVTFSAAIFHLNDPLWARGGSMPFVLTTPYLSVYNNTFIDLWRNAPGLFTAGSIGVILIQTVWEALMLPLMSFRLGRLFIALHGFAFFIGSGLLLFIGHLPLIELSLWLLIFGYPAFWLREKQADRSDAGQVDPSGRTSQRFLIGFTVVAFLIVTEFAIAHLLAALSWRQNNAIAARDPERPFLVSVLKDPITRRVFGQQPGVILSEADIAEAGYYIAFIETESDGTFRRIVPFLDDRGERLSFMRNDAFSHSQEIAIPIARQPPIWAVGGQAARGDINTIIDLDICLQGDTTTRPRYYTVILFNRQVDRSGYVPEWRDDGLGERQGQFVIEGDRLQAALNRCTPMWGVLPRRELTFLLRPDDQTRNAAVDRLRALGLVR